MKSALTLIVFVFFLCFGVSSAADSLKVGGQAPPIVLKDLSGKFIFLRDYCGKKLRNPWINKTKYPVIVNFWATYCIPCRKEIPELEKMLESYQGQVKMFLISIDKEGADVVEPFLKQASFSSPVLLDIHATTAERYGADRLPSLLLLDQEGIVRYMTVGYQGEESILKVETELKKILKPKTSEK